MRLLMLNYEFPPLGGGASPVTMSLSKELVKSGHEVDVVTMGFPGLNHRETVAGVNVYRLPVWRSRRDICHTHEMLSFDIAALPFSLRLMKRRRYHLNHTHFIVPTSLISYGLKKMTGLPYIVTSHGSDVEGYNPDRFGQLHKFLRPVWRRLTREADYITTPSEGLKSLILRRDNTLKVKVIPNGLYLPETNSFPRSLKILLVSRLFERKGFQYFLEAIRGLAVKVEINIVGDGPYRPKLEELAGTINSPIRFWGFLDSSSTAYKSLYASSSIFVFPSKMESFGLVLLEAMAYGLAIITTDISAIKEVGGEACLYVRPENASDIRLVLKRLLADSHLREELGKKARERAVKFSWPVITKDFISLYEEVVRSE